MARGLRPALSIGARRWRYLLALAQLTVAVAAAAWLVWTLGVGVGKVVVPAMAVVGMALWRAARHKPEPPHGLPVSREQEPRLWSLVDMLASEVGTRQPDEIRLIPEVKAAVTEITGFMGLTGGRRYLCIGFPLLTTMRMDQLAALLAHELGHYSHDHTRLGAVAYRIRRAIGGTLGRLGPYNIVGWVFKGFGIVYVLLDNVFARRQEYEADREAARIAGSGAMVSALRELPALEISWGFFFETYVAPGWEAGYVPDDVFGGFPAMLRARQGDLAELRGTKPDQTGFRWDAHPPIRARISAILDSPATPGRVDDSPAASMFTDFPGLGRALQRTLPDHAERTVLAWPEFNAMINNAHLQREADVVFRQVARTTRASRDITLGDILDLISQDRLTEIAAPFFPEVTRQESGVLFAGPLGRVMRLAAVRSEVADWRHSWSGPAEFVGLDGEALDLEEIAKLAVSSPSDLALARQRLAALGVDVKAQLLVERRLTADGAEVLAALSNVQVDDYQHYLVVLTNGLVLVPVPSISDESKPQLEMLLATTEPEELAQRFRYLPFEEISDTKITQESPVYAVISLHAGGEVVMKEGWTSEQVGRGSRRLLRDALTRLQKVGG